MLTVERSLVKVRSDLNIHISDAFQCVKEIKQLEAELAMLQLEVLTHSIDTSMSEVMEKRKRGLQVSESSEFRS